MQTERLAQSIILQAMDDLYDVHGHKESLDFFTGSGFYECATMASMDYNEMQGLLEIVSKIVTSPSARRSTAQAMPLRHGVYAAKKNCRTS